MDWTAAWVSLKLAVCTVAILLAAGLPLAWWLATTAWRGRFVVEAVVSLPIVLPPTVVGFYLLVAFGPDSPVGSALVAMTGRQLPFTFAGIVAASALFNLPFAVRPFTAGFESVDRRMIEAAWCLGLSRWRTFWRVALPLAWPGILTGLVLTFARAIGEFGVVLMVGGNIPGATRTISTLIYDQAQALDYRSANIASAVMLGFSFVILAAMLALRPGGAGRSGVRVRRGGEGGWTP